MIAKTLGAIDGVFGLVAGALKKVVYLVFVTAVIASAVTAVIFMLSDWLL
jgi:hypothetical protein